MELYQTIILTILYVIFIVCVFKADVEENNLTLLNEVIACQDRVDMETTNRARNYLVTGSEEEKRSYNDIASISNGPGNWMTISFYPPMKNYSLKTLPELYDMFTLYDNEKAYMLQADKKQQDNMFTEITAMNWFDGFEDEDGKGEAKFKTDKLKQFVRFTKEIENDKKEAKRKEAVNLLYSTEYMNKETEIVKLLDTGSMLILVRQISLVRSYHTIKYVLLLFIVLFHGYTFYKCNKNANQNSIPLVTEAKL
jgi:hypothetical protein